MYISNHVNPLSKEEIAAIPQSIRSVFPPGYIAFLLQYGAGTYRGWFHIQKPDDEALKPFAEYGLWEHDEDSPITQSQIGECISIGTSTDGDFLAVHPETGRLLWLPRHAEAISGVELPSMEEADLPYIELLDGLYRQVYGKAPEEAAYFEPWTETRDHLFLRLPPAENHMAIEELAARCRQAYPPDFVAESTYSCRLFYRRLGGCIRFNYANRQEVALFFEQSESGHSGKFVLEQWLTQNGCRRQE